MINQHTHIINNQWVKQGIKRKKSNLR
jgi:hypothetical protein